MTASFVPADRERRERAHALAKKGRMAEAERVFAEILAEQPDDAEALNFLAICAYQRGEQDGALALLARAGDASPDDATTQVNIGTLQRERGNLDAAYAAMKRGIELAPDLYAARLRLGEILQALGRTEEAACVYFGAITAAQTHGLWLNEASTEVELRPLVLHAMRVVSSVRHALFGALLKPLRERHGAAALARVEKALAIYLGDLPANYPQPMQRPLFFYFPDLPAPRVFDRELFPWYAPLEAQASAIRTEMLAVLAEDRGFEPFLGHVDDPSQLDNLLRGGDGTPAWNAFFFYRHGVPNQANMARCPQTSAALAAAPLCHVREHAPEVCFSVLTPGSHILPHRGVTNTRVVTHLALVVPSDCALVVSGHVQTWEEGRCFSFDDTFEHEAYNRSAQTRVVMLLDAWNPYMTKLECDAVAELIGGIGDFNRAAGI